MPLVEHYLRCRSEPCLLDLECPAGKWLHPLKDIFRKFEQNYSQQHDASLMTITAQGSAVHADGQRRGTRQTSGGHINLSENTAVYSNTISLDLPSREHKTTVLEESCPPRSGESGLPASPP